MLLATRCPVCEEPVAGWCRPCWRAVRPPPPDLPIPAAMLYDDIARRMLLALKYTNGRTMAVPVAQRIAPLVDADVVDIVTWAPTSRRRARRRGYDQAELIARAVAAELRLPCRSLLRRTDRSGPQTGRSRLERHIGPAFAARRVRLGARVLVLDDVVTTGASLRSAQQALFRSGALDVIAIAAAATPRRDHRAGHQSRIRLIDPEHLR
jgi:predicted amidophosphoribosyltransferase